MRARTQRSEVDAETQARGGMSTTDAAGPPIDLQVPWSVIQEDWIRTGELKRLCVRRIQRSGHRNPHEIDELYAEVSSRVWATWARRPDRMVTIRSSLEAYLVTIVKNAWFYRARREIRERDARLRIDQPHRPRGMPDPFEGDAAPARLRPQGALISLDDARWSKGPASQDWHGDPESVLDAVMLQQTVRALRAHLTHRLATGTYICPYHLATRSGDGCGRQPGMLFGAALGVVNRVPELKSWHSLFADVCAEADPARFGPATGATDQARRAHDLNRAKTRDRLEACVLHLVDKAIGDAGQTHSALEAAVRIPMTWAVLQKLTQHAKPDERASDKVVTALRGWLDQLLLWWRDLGTVQSRVGPREGWAWAGEDLSQRLTNSARVVERAAVTARQTLPAASSVESRRLARAEAIVEDLVYWQRAFSMSPTSDDVSGQSIA